MRDQSLVCERSNTNNYWCENQKLSAMGPQCVSVTMLCLNLVGLVACSGIGFWYLTLSYDVTPTAEDTSNPDYQNQKDSSTLLFVAGITVICLGILGFGWNLADSTIAFSHATRDSGKLKIRRSANQDIPSQNQGMKRLSGHVPQEENYEEIREENVDGHWRRMKGRYDNQK